MTFVNCKYWTPTHHVGICSKYFQETLLKLGKRTTLIWDLELVLSTYSEIKLIPTSIFELENSALDECSAEDAAVIAAVA